MRFESLNLRRFGHFTDFQIQFGQHTPGEPDLHVLYGPNEAGKSTTLAAIVDMLYGMKRKTPWNFLHDNKLLELEATLRQESHSVVLKCFKNHWANSENNRLERFPLDLQGLSREDYERRFSFDEQTLQAGGEQILNSDGDVGQALFSASAGLANLKERIDKVMAPANAFWMPNKRSNLQVMDLKSTLAENKKHMDVIELDTNKWKKRVVKLEEATLRRDAIRKSRDNLQQSIQQLEKRKSVQSLAVHYRNLVQQRDALASESIVPPDSILAADFLSAIDARAVLDNTREQLKDCENSQIARVELENQMQQLRQQLEKSAPDEKAQSLLKIAKTIRTLADESALVYEWQGKQSQCQHVIEQCNKEFDDASRRLALAEKTELANVVPGESQLAELQALLVQEQTLSSALYHAQEELDKLAPLPVEPDTANDQIQCKSAPDIDVATELLRSIQEEGLISQIATAQKKLLESQHALQVKSKRAGLSAEQLGKISLPDSQWLNSKLKELSELSGELQRVNEQLAELQAGIIDNQQACEKLVHEGAVDTEQLADSKAARDRAWSEHTRQIDDKNDHSALVKSATVFEKTLFDVDDLQQKVSSSHQLTAKLQLLKSQLRRDQEKHRTLSDIQLVEIQQQKKLCLEQLLGQVAPFWDAKDIDADLLRERHKQVSDLLIDCDAVDAHVLVLEELQLKASARSQKLLTLLEPLQKPERLKALEQLDFEDLLSQTSRQLDALKAQRLELNEQQRALSALKEIHDKRAGSLAAARKDLVQWQKRWQMLVQETLFADMNLPKARDTLTWIAKLPPLLSRHNEARQELNTLSLQLSTRESAIATVLEEQGEKRFGDVVSRLDAVSENVKTHETLKIQIKSLDDKIQANIEANAVNHRAIQSLRHAMKVESDKELIQLLIRTEQHRSLNDRCKEALAQLLDASDSASAELDIDQLCREKQDDSEAFEQRLNDLKAELEDAKTLYDTTNEARALAEREMQESGDENEHAHLSLERRNLILQTAELARKCAIARSGQTVLHAAIAKFRQEHQSVILSEAQKAFSTLTAGRYTRLLPRDDGKGNEKLYVIDDSRKARDVTDLSTGTRYQLYLALRAAAYADYATQRTPLPFVADDIMESFDDERSAAAFEVLANMAKKGQVIYLTHHQHLISMAQDIVGKDRVSVHYYS